VHSIPVQEASEQAFLELSAGDILFIDSSHVVKIGSDVHFLLLDILPQLAPGVLVHFHDICMPFEYPRQYTVNPSARYLWNEGYFLQAFLAHNTAYEIVLAMAFLLREYSDEVRNCFPIRDKEIVGSSGGFWLRRV